MNKKKDNKERKENRRRFEGVVVGNKMDKTVKVLVETKRIHPKYKKVVGYRKVYFARTEKDLQEGDAVTIKEARPFSKNVRWIVI